MKYKLIILLLSITVIGSAQYDIDTLESDTLTKEPKVNLFELKKKIYVGTDLSLSFGSLTYIYLAPLIGYDITKKFSGGFSTMYQLLRAKSFSGNIVSENSFGAGMFLRYRPIQQFMLHTELDLINTVDYSVAFGRVNVPAYFLGAGYTGQLGDRVYYSFLVSYEFIRNPNMPVPAFVNIQGVPFYLKYGFVWYLG